jgi:hypothetical protein
LLLLIQLILPLALEAAAEEAEPLLLVLLPLLVQLILLLALEATPRLEHPYCVANLPKKHLEAVDKA